MTTIDHGNNHRQIGIDPHLRRPYGFCNIIHQPHLTNQPNGCVADKGNMTKTAP